MSHKITGTTLTPDPLLGANTVTVSGNWQNGFDGPVVIVDIGGKPTQVSAARVAAALGKTVDQIRSPFVPEARNG